MSAIFSDSVAGRWSKAKSTASIFSSNHLRQSLTSAASSSSSSTSLALADISTISLYRLKPTLCHRSSKSSNTTPCARSHACTRVGASATYCSTSRSRSISSMRTSPCAVTGPHLPVLIRLVRHVRPLVLPAPLTLGPKLGLVQVAPIVLLAHGDDLVLAPEEVWIDSRAVGWL